MNRLPAVFVAILLMTFLVACSSAPKGGYESVADAPRPAATAAPRAPGAQGPAGPAGSPGMVPVPAPTQPPAARQPAPSDQMIVRSGSLSLLVDDVAGTLERIARMAETRRGYVVASQSWREGERLRGLITLRVPVEEFSNAMREIGGLAAEVVSQNTSAKDVTEEYVDLKAKLQNLEAAEQQLIKILARAEKIEDVLNVQRELTRVRGEIEQTKGRTQYLERTSATSLIEVRLEQVGLQVKFTVNRRFIEPGETVRFTAQVSGGFAPFSYQWVFGDGESSNDASPSHSYTDTGSYSVTLKVTDDRDNTVSETNEDYVSVVAPPGWSAGKVVTTAWNGLVGFARVLSTVLIWLAIFSPVWIIAGGIVLFARWRRKKK